MENHNALRYDDKTNPQIGLEISWGKDLVSHPSFSFFIACNEVNTYLGIKYFLKGDGIFMNFLNSWVRC